MQQRLIPAAMEPRGVCVVPEPFGGGLTVYSSTQIPHILRTMLAVTTGVPESRLRVVAPSVGGGFGSKLNVYAEELVCVALARRLGQPVRWTEERMEAAQATIQGRGQIQDIELAADAEGKLLAVRVELLADMGAYLQLVTPGIPLAGRVPLPRRLRRPGLLVPLHVGLHDQDADRRLPGRRPPGGHLRDRAGDGRPRPQGGRRPGGDPAAQLHRGRQVPLFVPGRARLRQRELRADPHPGARDRQGGPGALRAGERVARPAPPAISALGISTLRRDVRPGAEPGARLAELLRRRLGGGDGAGDADGQGPGRHRHDARTARGTRPRGR